MKNQYLADAGDYGKYGLLRFLAGKGIRISVNWYLTPNDPVPVDGNKRKYLTEDKEGQPDPELFEAMEKLSRNNFPSVRDIEKMDLIPGAEYYTPEVDRVQREKWFSLFMDSCRGDLAFLDPDTGIRRGPAPATADSVKYVYTDEIGRLCKAGRNIVCYCHRGRRSDEDWEKFKSSLYHAAAVIRVFCLTYHRGVQRSFLFIVQKEDAEVYSRLLKEFLETGWGQEKGSRQAPFTMEGVKEPEETRLTPTSLLLSRQYPTYQALLLVGSRGEMGPEDCFKKTVLYIVDWFRKRIDRNILLSSPDLEALRTYPAPEDYRNFQLEDHANIRILSLMSVRSFYWKERGTWTFRLVEPDNGTEKSGARGRQFTTDVSVTLTGEGAVLGVRITCREPLGNRQDALVFRPAFVRTIFRDPDLILSEEGTDPAFAFGDSPLLLNGRSQTECASLAKGLVLAVHRQMPVVFLPESFYEEFREPVCGMTRSLAGYGHVVVVQRGARKLFLGCMEAPDCAGALEEDRIVLYRGTSPVDGTVYEADFFDTDGEEEITDTVKNLVMQEPLRKRCSFFGYPFNKELWDAFTDSRRAAPLEGASGELERCREQLEEMRAEKGDILRDSEELKVRIRDLERKLAQKEAGLLKECRERQKCEKINEKLSAEKKALEERAKALEEKAPSASRDLRNEREKYEPILNLPVRFDRSDVLEWAEIYFGDCLIFHPRAKRAFESSSRRIDLRRLCLMLYYLAHYTRLRAKGEAAGESTDLTEALQEYDLDGLNLSVTPVGDTSFYKSQIKIKIHAYDPDVRGEQVMPLHMKYDVAPETLIRIYFLYSRKLGKSIIGYLPDHIDKV